MPSNTYTDHPMSFTTPPVLLRKLSQVVSRISYVLVNDLSSVVCIMVILSWVMGNVRKIYIPVDEGNDNAKVYNRYEVDWLPMLFPIAVYIFTFFTLSLGSAFIITIFLWYNKGNGFM